MLSPGLGLVTYPWYGGIPSTPSSALPCPATGGRGAGPAGAHPIGPSCCAEGPCQPQTCGAQVPLPRQAGEGAVAQRCPRRPHDLWSPVQPAGPVEERAGLQHDPLGPGHGRDLLGLLPHRRGGHQQADPGVTPARGPAAPWCQGAAHLRLHRAVAVCRYSSTWHSIPGQPAIPCPCWERGAPRLVPCTPRGTQRGPGCGHGPATRTCSCHGTWWAEGCLSGAGGRGVSLSGRGGGGVRLSPGTWQGWCLAVCPGDVEATHLGNLAGRSISLSRACGRGCLPVCLPGSGGPGSPAWRCRL